MNLERASTRKWQLAVAVVIVATAAVLGLFKWKSLRPAPASDKELIASFKDYKKWIRVNDPILMSRAVATACLDIPLGEDGSLRHKPNTADGSPHIEKYAVVYVNDIAVKPMFGEGPPVFPVGSVIVKEKLPTRESTTPELLTVMIKREKGFNPGNGDWQYLVADGDARGIRQRDNVENCRQCHETRKHNGYVFQTYTPIALARERKKLEEFHRMFETELGGTRAINGDEPPDELSLYKLGTRVNDEPKWIPLGRTGSATSFVNPEDPIRRNPDLDPHGERFIVVWVNEIGQSAMTEQANPRFPVGSVIVCEEYSPREKDSSTPELLTAMIKRNAGFNPEGGDWEFLVVGEDFPAKVRQRGKLATCMGCHENRKDADFVFRQYLPEKARAALK